MKKSKKMKRTSVKSVIIALTIFITNGLSAQDYSLDISNPSSTKIVIVGIKNLKLEGHDANTMQVSSSSSKEDFPVPEKAKGLKRIGAGGYDNTGIGLSVRRKDGNELWISQVSHEENLKSAFTIRVPANIQIRIENSHHVNFHQEEGRTELEGVSGELEISELNNSVYLKDVTGPALVNTVYGKIEAEFTSLSQRGPTSLLSINETVDVTLPEDTKADLLIESLLGVYSDMDVELLYEEDQLGRPNSFEAKINGGGVSISFKAVHKEVFLRKKKK